mgnify:CR=1 FL=1
MLSILMIVPEEFSERIALLIQGQVVPKGKYGTSRKLNLFPECMDFSAGEAMCSPQCFLKGIIQKKR